MRKLWLLCLVICYCYAQYRPRTTFKMTPSTTPSTRTTGTTKQVTIVNPSKSLCDNDICLCTKNRVRVSCTCKENNQEITVSYYRQSQENSLPAEVEEFSVERCRRVKIAKNSISSASKLQRFKVNDVSSLEVETYGFQQNRTRMVGYQNSAPFSTHLDSPRKNDTDISILISESNSSLTIDIRNTGITELSTRSFAGSLDAIEFRNCHFLHPLVNETFYKLNRLRVLLFNESTLSDIESGAFHEVSTEYLVIARSRIRSIRENALVIHVAQITVIRHCTIDSIRMQAIQIATPETFTFFNNTVKTLHRHALQVMTRGRVTIEHCQFKQVNNHAFHYVNSTRTNDDLHFRGNTFENYDSAALHFNDSYNPAYIQLDPLYLAKDYCTCNPLPILLKLLGKNQTRKRRHTPFFTLSEDYSVADYIESHGMASTSDEKQDNEQNYALRKPAGTTIPTDSENYFNPTTTYADRRTTNVYSTAFSSLESTEIISTIPTNLGLGSTPNPKFNDGPGRELEDLTTIDKLLAEALKCVTSTGSMHSVSYQMEYCDNYKHNNDSKFSLDSIWEKLLYIGLPAVILVVFGVVLALCCFCSRRRKRKNQTPKDATLSEAQLMELLGMPRKGSANPNQQANINSGYETQSSLPNRPPLTGQGSSQWVLAVPDPKMYKETEVQIVVEYAKPMEDLKYRDSYAD